MDRLMNECMQNLISGKRMNALIDRQMNAWMNG